MSSERLEDILANARKLLEAPPLEQQFSSLSLSLTSALPDSATARYPASSSSMCRPDSSSHPLTSRPQTAAYTLPSPAYDPFAAPSPLVATPHTGTPSLHASPSLPGPNSPFTSPLTHGLQSHHSIHSPSHTHLPSRSSAPSLGSAALGATTPASSLPPTPPAVQLPVAVPPPQLPDAFPFPLTHPHAMASYTQYSAAQHDYEQARVRWQREQALLDAYTRTHLGALSSFPAHADATGGADAGVLPFAPHSTPAAAEDLAPQHTYFHPSSAAPAPSPFRSAALPAARDALFPSHVAALSAPLAADALVSQCVVIATLMAKLWPRIREVARACAWRRHIAVDALVRHQLSARAQTQGGNATTASASAVAASAADSQTSEAAAVDGAASRKAVPGTPSRRGKLFAHVNLTASSNTNTSTGTNNAAGASAGSTRARTVATPLRARVMAAAGVSIFDGDSTAVGGGSSADAVVSADGSVEGRAPHLLGGGSSGSSAASMGSSQSLPPPPSDSWTAPTGTASSYGTCLSSTVTTTSSATAASGRRAGLARHGSRAGLPPASGNSAAAANANASASAEGKKNKATVLAQAHALPPLLLPSGQVIDYSGTLSGGAGHPAQDSALAITRHASAATALANTPTSSASLLSLTSPACSSALSPSPLDHPLHIAVVGAGRIGSHLTQRLAGSGVVPPSQVVVVTRRGEVQQPLGAEGGGAASGLLGAWPCVADAVRSGVVHTHMHEALVTGVGSAEEAGDGEALLPTFGNKRTTGGARAGASSLFSPPGAPTPTGTSSAVASTLPAPAMARVPCALHFICVRRSQTHALAPVYRRLPARCPVVRVRDTAMEQHVAEEREREAERERERERERDYGKERGRPRRKERPCPPPSLEARLSGLQVGLDAVGEAEEEDLLDAGLLGDAARDSGSATGSGTGTTAAAGGSRRGARPIATASFSDTRTTRAPPAHAQAQTQAAQQAAEDAVALVVARSKHKWLSTTSVAPVDTWRRVRRPKPGVCIAVTPQEAVRALVPLPDATDDAQVWESFRADNAHAVATVRALAPEACAGGMAEAPVVALVPPSPCRRCFPFGVVAPSPNAPLGVETSEGAVTGCSLSVDVHRDGSSTLCTHDSAIAAPAHCTCLPPSLLQLPLPPVPLFPEMAAPGLADPAAAALGSMSAQPSSTDLRGSSSSSSLTSHQLPLTATPAAQAAPHALLLALHLPREAALTIVNPHRRPANIAHVQAILAAVASRSACRFCRALAERCVGATDTQWASICRRLCWAPSDGPDSELAPHTQGLVTAPPSRPSSRMSTVMQTHAHSHTALPPSQAHTPASVSASSSTRSLHHTTSVAYSTAATLDCAVTHTPISADVLTALPPPCPHADLFARLPLLRLPPAPLPSLLASLLPLHMVPHAPLVVPLCAGLSEQAAASLFATPFLCRTQVPPPLAHAGYGHWYESAMASLFHTLSALAPVAYRYAMVEVHRYLVLAERANARVYDRYVDVRTRSLLCLQHVLSDTVKPLQPHEFGYIPPPPVRPVDEAVADLADTVVPSLSSPALEHPRRYTLITDAQPPGAVRDVSWGASLLLEAALRESVAETAESILSGAAGVLPVTWHSLREMERVGAQWQQHMHTAREREAAGVPSADADLSQPTSADLECGAPHPLLLCPVGAGGGLGMRANTTDGILGEAPAEPYTRSPTGAASAGGAGVGEDAWGMVGAWREQALLGEGGVAGQCTVRTTQRPGLLKDLLSGEW